MLMEPTVALYQVKKEILRIKPVILEMLETSRCLFQQRDMELCTSIKSKDKQVDLLRREIVIFLTKIARLQLAEAESKKRMADLFIVNELENLGDVIDKNIQDRAKKLLKQSLQFSEEGMQEITELFETVKSNFVRCMDVFEQNDSEKAKELLKFFEKSQDFQSELRRKHFLFTIFFRLCWR